MNPEDLQIVGEKMHSKGSWDDLKFVLTVARTGSLSAAAVKLGVNHATVLRRVKAFENKQGIELFHKTVRGYHVNPDFQRVLDALGNAEAAIASVDRAVTGAQAPLHGLVRITSTDTFCATFLPEIVGDIQRENPNIKVEVISSNLHVNLSTLDADITVRPAPELSDDLVGEKVGSLTFSVYQSNGYSGDAWLGLSGPLTRSTAGQWFANIIKTGSKVGTSSDSFITLEKMAERGMGRVILPDLIGRANTKLEVCEKGPQETATPIWVATHRDLVSSASIRAVQKRLILGAKARANVLSA